MFEAKRVFIRLKEKNNKININAPIATVGQLIDNPPLTSVVVREMLIFQDMGLDCQIYVEGNEDDQ